MFTASRYVWRLRPSKRWVIVISLAYFLWFLCISTWSSRTLNGLFMLVAVYLWLLEISFYARRGGAELTMTAGARSGWRNSNFRLWLWHPRLIVAAVYDEQGANFIPVLKDSMERMDYHRLLQMTWRIKSERYLVNESRWRARRDSNSRPSGS